GQMAIGEHITTVQAVFGRLFNAGTDFCRDGSQFDRLLTDGDEFSVGNIQAKAIHTPGHTPACMTYLIGDAGFVGDTLFMPDFGTARVDFPGGDASTLFNSIQKIFTLPDQTRLFMCHDYKAPGRDYYSWETTVAEEKAKNIHVGSGTSEQEFIKMRTTRDQQLDMPRLILPSVQVNMRAGDLPPADENGVRYLKIPVDAI
ncbi:MAG: MBL fold metallo-hydrolase, partial [Motiliproteus sp.]|nr:MBL fold metallo-hydrolase [Motiliproteus sp.]